MLPDRLRTEPSQTVWNRKLRFGVMMLCGIFMVIVAGCDRSPSDETGTAGAGRPSMQIEPVSRPAAPSQGYVGSESCTECHPDIAAFYRTHPMAHSLTEILEEPVEDYRTSVMFESFPGCEYDVTATESGVSHTERLIGREGETLVEQTVPVDYAVGSGRRGRSYLINRDGLLFMSPVTWYTEGQRFDLSPGYRPESHPRFGRRISDGCLACHAGLTETVTGGPHRYSSTVFLEKSIGCERCHGPGRDHIAFHTSADLDSPASNAKTDPIVNPAHLSPQLREDVCNQCHIQGIERILRYGRTEFDFRPGNRLSDVWATFVAGDRIDQTGAATRAVSQVEQMHASRCFQQSDGRLSCISCHDPHRSPSPEERLQFYRGRCLVCHEQNGANCSESLNKRNPVQDSCIDCHMPSLNASDVPHTSQTDHRVLRAAATGMNASPLAGEPRLFRDGESELSSAALQRVRGLLLAHTAESRGDRGLAQQARSMLQSLPGVFSDDPELQDALGSVSYLLGDYAAAAKHWLEVVEIQPARESALEGLMLVARQQRRHADALQYADRLLVLNDWRLDFHLQRAQILADLGRPADAIEAAQRGLDKHPASVPLYRWLTEACDRSGRTAEAEKYRQRLERILSVIPGQPP